MGLCYTCLHLPPMWVLGSKFKSLWLYHRTLYQSTSPTSTIGIFNTYWQKLVISHAENILLLAFSPLFCSIYYLNDTIVSWHIHSWSFNSIWPWDFFHSPRMESFWEKWHLWFPNTWTDGLPIGEIRRSTEAPQHRAQPNCLVWTALKHCNGCYYIHPASITVGGHNFALGHSGYLPQSQGNYSLNTLEICDHDGRFKKWEFQCLRCVFGL